MKKLIAVAMICMLAVYAAAAQDWQSDGANENQYNCALINALIDGYGEQDLIEDDAGEHQSVAEFLRALFPACESEPSGRLAELVEAEDPALIRVLVEGAALEWGEPRCSILIDDFYDERFTFLLGGIALDRIALDVYLPGESQAVEMDTVISDVTQSGKPIRLEQLAGDEFPLGDYVFDVRIDGELFHFVWMRNDQAMNTFSLVCQEEEPAEADAEDDDAPEAEVAGSVDAEESADDRAQAESAADAISLADGDTHSLANLSCVVAISDDHEDDFNVSLVGNNIDQLSVDVYLPDESKPLRMDESHEYKQDIGTEVPARVEWATGDDFPLGLYRFDVRIGDDSYRFQWERADASYRTIVLACFGDESPIPTQSVLGDDDRTFIADAGCLVWTEAWDEDFNIIITGENQDGMTVEVTFPGEDQPAEMDSEYSGSLDDGTPYRVEWITGSEFPLGAIEIDVRIDEQLYEYQWEREDQSINSFGIECIADEEE